MIAMMRKFFLDGTFIAPDIIAGCVQCEVVFPLKGRGDEGVIFPMLSGLFFFNCFVRRYRQ